MLQKLFLFQLNADLSVHQRILKKMYSTVLNIDNNNSAVKRLITINHIQKIKVFVYIIYSMCVCCVYLLCICKYTHACIYLRKICYVYILNIFI